MVNISIVIPHLNLPGTNDALSNCVTSFPDNLNIEWILVNDVKGYAKAVNQGMKKSTGDFIFVVNDDTQIISGDITKMCELYCVTIPQITPEPRDNKPRCFFCVPRGIYNEVKHFGAEDFYDERFYPGYFEDDDLIVRLDWLRIETILVPEVIVNHAGGGGLTIKQFGEQEAFDVNKKRFEDKWATTLYT